MDDVRKQLRDAAAEHRPDRERMLARVERGMERDAAPGAPSRGGLPRPAPWLRIAGATAAVAGVLALGGYAVASVVHGDEPSRTVGTPATPELPAATKPLAPDAKGVEDGYLWSDGSIDPQSNDFWAQSTLTFKTGKPLTALTVELRVAQTGGVADTGNWRSLPADDFTVSVREAGGEAGGDLVYRWTLKAGRTVPAGKHVFAGQYNHAEGGRDAGDDAYAAEATASGLKAAVRGDFARTS
ncbi:hypothetical protein OG453_21035 [Streptomyces sp. NBC_01381]|uniref:hypothetical protein n=1 Tax=Streptomyces sp. NBC_01381 TaxID=2903845 RepID=UPI0022557373|nr:hypothetical protein [Streptomyces sp. NBC_01381]MCX4669127.1 hypothetical protein [Streptomyces sp. NBC_01381]